MHTLRAVEGADAARSAVLGALLLMLQLGCAVPAEDASRSALRGALRYRCEPPAGLAETWTWIAMDGSRETVDATPTYRAVHREGWLGLIRWYRATGELRDPKRPLLIKEPGNLTTARFIGWSEARTRVAKALMVHDPERVRAALRELYGPDPEPPVDTERVDERGLPQDTSR